MKTPLNLGLLLLVAWGCSINKSHINKELHDLENTFHNHTGFVLYDPEDRKTLVSYSGSKYFTPASNTKILTLYLSMQTIGDSIPGINYIEKGDSLIFWGTGDPSLLNKRLPESHVLAFLKNTEKNLYFSPSNYYDLHFGPGWAWDDYPYTYSSEKSPLPIYGNNLEVNKSTDQQYLTIEQPFFKRYFWLGDSTRDEDKVIRDYYSNNTLYFPSVNNTHLKEEYPFHYSDLLLADLLSDTLKKKVRLINKAFPKEYKTIYSIPADSAYQVMMRESDNFIAEQLLLTCSGILTDSLRSENALLFGLENIYNNAPDSMVWVDGSGLSRYNLFTPRSLVWLWEKLYQEVPQNRLFNLIASGGQAGTLKNYYISEEPYIYGKTGTLSNNHNLSGFLRTKKGKLYIFAFMNNNYPDSSKPIKIKMEQILREIYLNN